MCLQGFPQVLHLHPLLGDATLQNLMGELESIHGGSMERGSEIVLKKTCEVVHLLVKLPAISLQACKFIKNEFLHTNFSRIQVDFKLFIVFQNSKSTYFSKHLLMLAFVITCNNSQTCIFNLLEKCFSFLLFILTQWLPFLNNFSHR